MKPMNNDTMAQREALINEYKGNLFEYLVGSFLSRLYGVERSFVAAFGGEMKDRLSFYESSLREFDPELIRALPLLAEKCACQLKERLPGSIDNILVAGKVAAGGGDSSWNEADLIVLANNQHYPLSLKLCKSHAFVNTKSGGIKSFVTKYFSLFPKAQKWQKKLNQSVDEGFLEMGHSLYEFAGLEFSGKFDEQWEKAGYSELPGQLSHEMSEVVTQNYYKVIKTLYLALRDFFESDRELFIQSLAPLLGLGNTSILQMTCFHGEEKQEGGDKKRYQLKQIHFFDFQKFKQEKKEIQLMKLKDQISSFEISFDALILQIRVKPMNKFTVPGLKVNCSVKQKSIS